MGVDVVVVVAGWVRVSGEEMKGETRSEGEVRDLKKIGDVGALAMLMGM
jgi:hypothetical protein